MELVCGAIAGSYAADTTYRVNNADIYDTDIYDTDIYNAAIYNADIYDADISNKPYIHITRALQARVKGNVHTCRRFL